jgi:hypothetical protein
VTLIEARTIIGALAVILIVASLCWMAADAIRAVVKR